MTNEDFQAAIEQDQYDVVTRFAYADWLLENNRPTQSQDQQRRGFLNAIYKDDSDGPRLDYARWLRSVYEMNHAELIERSIRIDGVRRETNETTHPPMYSDVTVSPRLLTDESNLKSLLWNATQDLLTWDRGLVVGLTLNCSALVCLIEDKYSPMFSHMVKTIRLTDWRGAYRVIPKDPKRYLLWLKQLELPSSFQTNPGYSDPYLRVGTVSNDSTDEWIGFTRKLLPGVDVVLWDDYFSRRTVVAVMDGGEQHVMQASGVIRMGDPLASDRDGRVVRWRPGMAGPLGYAVSDSRDER